MSRIRQRAREVVEGFTEGEQFEEFQADPEDFLSARERGGGTAGTRIAQQKRRETFLRAGHAESKGSLLQTVCFDRVVRRP